MLDELGELVHAEPVIVAERADGVARSGETLLGEAGRAVDGGTQFGRCIRTARELAHHFELDRQPGQRVGQDVVQVAGDAGPLLRRSRPCLVIAGFLKLREEQFGALLAEPVAPQESARDAEHCAQERGSGDRRGTGTSGRAERDGDAGGDRRADGDGEWRGKRDPGGEHDRAARQFRDPVRLEHGDRDRARAEDI